MGMVLAILTVARVIEYLLECLPAPTYAFFFGLILASACFLPRYIGKLRIKYFILLLFGFLFAALFITFESIQMVHSLPMIFLSGIIALCVMILPGISGAFMLLFLGQYEYMLHALNSLCLPEILTFILGGLIGLLIFSRFLGYLLEKYRASTISFLFGLMLGALLLPYQIITNMDIPISIPAVLIPAILGFSIAFFASWMARS
jgi:putative membrane protein